MVVVHVGDDHVAHRVAVHAKRLETLGDRINDCALALARATFIEAGVDHDGAQSVAHHPDIVVERHGSVVRIAPDEILGRVAIDTGVADREGFVSVVAHRAICPQRRKLRVPA